jgi:hypothetical protein
MKDNGDTGFEKYGADKFCNFINCRMARPPGQEVTGAASKWSLDSLSVIGGGSGLNPNNWLGADLVSQWTSKTPIGTKFEGSKEYSRYAGYMNVKGSLVLSVLTICIPGIIYNLEKYREIECGYIDCLDESISTGVPADACDKVKEYQTCKYIFGEIFQAIPFTAFYNYFVNMIKNALSDPFSVIGVALGASCQYLCPAPTGDLYSACMWIKILAELGDIISNVQSIVKSDTWSIKNDVCHTVKDRHENAKNKASNTTTSSKILGIF